MGHLHRASWFLINILIHWLIIKIKNQYNIVNKKKKGQKYPNIINTINIYLGPTYILSLFRAPQNRAMVTAYNTNLLKFILV